MEKTIFNGNEYYIEKDSKGICIYTWDKNIVDKSFIQVSGDEYTGYQTMYKKYVSCRNNLLVLMTKTNKFYCFTDGLLLYLGGSVDEMFNCVVDECQEAVEID